jgi:RsiW-degrading membrane proteinase PrsW (M82 family)
MSTAPSLQVTFDGRVFTFAAGTTVRVGRSSENDIVVNDPTVSRRHAQISCEATGWVWQSTGQAPTFLAGQPAAQFAVGQQVDVTLASPQGPALHLVTAASHGQAGPGRTELAGDGLAGDGLAGDGLAGDGLAGDGLAGDGLAGDGLAGPAEPGHAPGQNFAAARQNYWPGVPPQRDPAQVAPAGMPRYPGVPIVRDDPAVPAQAGIPLSQLDTGSFFETLIPVRSWLHDRGWRQGIRLLIIPYALLPLIFVQVFSASTSLRSPGWAYSLYIAPLWLLTFWYLIRPPVIRKREVVIGIGIVIWTIIWLHLVTIYINDHFANTNSIAGSLVVGYNEEITKALPVLIAAIGVLKIKKQKLDPRTWFLMGTVAGLTFGVIEQSIYTPAAIVQIHGAHVNSQADVGVLTFAFRVFVDGFQHAVWAGLSGFFIGIAVNYRRRRIPLLLLGISIPAILHALNDYTLTIFSTAWAGVLVQAVSLLLFLGYTLSASAIERRVRRNPNFRGQSIMMERFSQPEQPSSP